MSDTLMSVPPRESLMRFITIPIEVDRLESSSWTFFVPIGFSSVEAAARFFISGLANFDSSWFTSMFRFRLVPRTLERLAATFLTMRERNNESVL